MRDGLYMPQSGGALRRRNSFAEDMGDRREQWRARVRVRVRVGVRARVSWLGCRIGIEG